MQIRYVRLEGGYVVECRFDEYYKNPRDEWPTGYAWFYEVKDNYDDVLASGGPYTKLYLALSQSFNDLMDVEYDRTGFEYRTELYDNGSKYMVVVRDLRDDSSHEGEHVVFSEHICDHTYRADLESHEALAYLAELHSSAFNKYYNYWAKQA